jgi:hypothetical protein
MMSFNAPVCVRNPEEWRDVVDRLPVISATDYGEAVFSGETPYDWTKMSVAESGEDAWDPQIDMQPMDLEGAKLVLDWERSERPEGYTIPDVYTDAQAHEQVAELYETRFDTNPLKQE